jgi:hypothetical protein
LLKELSSAKSAEPAKLAQVRDAEDCGKMIG